MNVSERTQRLLVYFAVGIVWLFAGAIGMQIGLDIGNVTFR